MAAITARPPTSRYQAPLPRRHLPPTPPTWSTPVAAWKEPPALWRFVLLSLVLHALFIALFGAPSGGSREGRAMWGSMSVELRGMLIGKEPVPYIAPPAQPPKPETVEAPPAPARADRGPAEGAVPLTPPAETQAAAVAPSGPAIVEVPTPFPSLLDRVRTEVRLDEPPPLRVPPPTAGQDLRPPPRERPEATQPVEVPSPLPVTPAARPERVLAEPPTIAAPVLQPIPTPPAPTPAPAPTAAPAARAPAQEPPVPLAPSTQPVDAQPVEIRTIPVPPLESLSTPRPAATPVEMSPLPDIRVAPAAPPAMPGRAASPATPSRPEQEPARAPGDLSGSSMPEGRRDLPMRRGEDRGGNYDPTAPSLDPEALRRRAGQLAREGSGQRALLPFPMPAVPAKKSQMESAIESARKPDCRTAYQGLGLAAIVPLIANEFGEGNCRW